MPYCKAKMHQNQFFLGLRFALDPTGGAYSATIFHLHSCARPQCMGALYPRWGLSPILPTLAPLPSDPGDATGNVHGSCSAFIDPEVKRSRLCTDYIRTW